MINSYDNVLREITACGAPISLRLAAARPGRIQALRGVLFAAAALYAILQMAPHAVFAHTFIEGRFRLHSDRPIDASERAALLEAAQRIQASGFDDPALQHEVFLCHDAGRFAIFAPLSREALGITNLVGVSFVRAGTKRSLASLIAHEWTHTLLARSYGALGHMMLAEWKREGVCEVVAGEISYDVEKGKAMLRAGHREDSGAFRYFTHWLAVRGLVEDKGLTLQQVISQPRSEAEALEAAIEALLEP